MTANAPAAEAGETAELLIFGDLTASFDAELRRLLHVRGNEAMISFFERVALRLRQELGRQPSAVQNMFPRFTTLIDLVSGFGDRMEGEPVMQFFLMTVCQLAKFIHFASGRPFPSPKKAYLLGICTGSFAASAICVSQSVSEVVVAGVEASMAAFRTALRSVLQRDMITKAGNKNWSAVVSRDKPVDELIEKFTSENKPYHSRLSKLYISATTPFNATVSGPPDTLTEFLARNNLAQHRLPIESPFHAPHIFHEADVEYVLEGFPAEELAEFKPRIPIISGSTGEVIEAADLKSLLRTASTSVLREVVAWEKILISLSTAFGARKMRKCNVYPFYYNSTSLLSSYLTREAKIEVAVHNMIGALPAQQPTQPTGRLDQSKIAIIGYSGRFPEATSNDEFWNLLRAGRDVHRTIPEDRFNWETYHDPTGKKRNTNKVKHGCFINEPGLFDTQFFNMSPREANSTDPAQRLAITATYEAMEMAGMVPNRTPSTQQDRIGVFFGVTSDDWREVNSSQDVDTYFIPGGVRAFMPGRISYFFRFSGPSLCIDTACSSSFAAIQSACGYLLRGECDTAIAGGTNVLTNPDIFTGLDRGHFLAKSGNCNTFDDEASGYCRAEGVGAVILKRLEDALEDKDPIFGVIAGSNTNHCGQTDSITRPHEGDQVSVFKRVLRYQGVDPNDISYVEMHGTGTQAGDATEMRSVLSVFLPDQQRAADRPLYLGSAKANIGHSESASGVVSLIKALMMMKNNEIPPHCGIKTRINRNYPKDLAQRNVRIALEPTPWRRQDSAGGMRRMFLNNFSAAGGNTALLLEDAPTPQEEIVHSSPGQREKRGTYLVTVTAKSAKSLTANIERLVSFLEENPSCSLPALSYTATARRIHHGYRVACSGASIAAIVKELKQRAQSQTQVRKRPSAKAPKVAFVFTGQGNLYTSMGRELYDTVPSFREDLVQFNAMAQQHGFPPFLSLIDGSVSSLEGVETCVGHLALASLQMALSRLWNTWNVRPSVVVGHSLGEYAALFAAGVISASDAILLVGTRATLLARHCTPGTHGMMAIKAPKDAILPLLAGSSCEITCINQPGGTVVGGKKRDLDKLATKVQSEGYSYVPLDIPFSFHTSQVDPILAEFEKAARDVQYCAPKIPVLSPLLSSVIQEGEAFAGDYLVRACRGVVDFQGALEAARIASLVDQETIWLEMGSHPACSGMIKGTLGPQSTALASVRTSTSPWSCIVSALESMYTQGLDIDWNNFHRDSGESHQVIQLPRYGWDLKNYWIAYKNDWLLTKGECCSGAAKPVQAKITSEAAVLPAARYISPSVQRVLQEKHTSGKSTMLAESDLFDTRLVHVLRGHKVNGVALCPSSLYGDVALTVGKALVKGCDTANFTGFDVSDVKVDRPLIAHPSQTSCLFRVSATAEWASQLISVSIYSVDQAGNTTEHHAKANVRLSVDTSAWLADWNTVAYLIRGRIASLERGVIGGNSHRLKRSMVYKLFNSIVDYSGEYQGMQEVILDSEELEATAKVTFRVDNQGFVMNPHWIDSLGHLAGFIMNGNEYSQSDQQVFINHGWSRLRFGEMPREGKVYTTYNKMQLVENKLYAGDTYILDGDRIIAMFDRVAFQAIPRKIIDKLLPRTNETAPVSSIKRNSPPSKELWLAATPAAAPVAAPAPALAPAQSSSRRPSATPSGDLDFARVLTIIAEEVGIELTELQPEIQLVDFGLDSLLSLTISSRISDEMGLDLPATLFAEHPTVKDLQSYFAAEGSIPRETPELSSYNSDDESSASTVAADEFPPPDTGAVTARIRQAIADETGIPVDELESAASLADLGVDSLLSLTIADSLTETLGTEVSSSLLLESRTLKDLEATIGKELGWNNPNVTVIDDIGTLKPSKSILSAPSKSIIVSAPKVVDPIVANEPHATSIVLRRASTPVPRRVLFLLPDGSGSAASYAPVAKLDPSVKVFGLNCPWRTNPEEMTRLGVTTSQVVAKYVAEIQRHQPHGPYYLGGWSAGGLFAFEATRALMAAGEVVERLLLIDAPNPIGLENPPSRMFDFFDKAGVFGKMTGGKVVPRWLRHHFDATVNMLDGYVPMPLPGAPPSLVIYARDGICHGPDAPQMEMAADDPREMLWLLRDRTDFSASGWVSLLGRRQVKVQVLSDVNHFSMMDEGPRMEEMREWVRRDFLEL